MSVYTAVAADELAAWLAPLGVGPLEKMAGIAAGMQNSNYFVTAGGRRWVLTLFEHLAPRELDFYLALQEHLAGRGIPCPRP
ncbi:MAG: phosphotransferase, partial [Betaproteobacteria bacterium]